MGWRGRGRTGTWPGAGPFSNLPPWQRPGWVYGYGRWTGLGRGVGYGISGSAYNPWVCQRLPWLPRGWWANPYAQLYGSRYPLVYGYPPIYPNALSPDAELDMLGTYLEQLKNEQETINKRIADLKKMIEEGGKTGTTQPTGSMPFWGPFPYVMLTPEQERSILEQQAKMLEDQINAIKKRLEDLGKEE
ncbi:DUF5320 domain-containing protein [Candidatus Bathyarchaeota archaeon]|nr:DUF5320 domain-containing protein [Candidatus Bathyarchaeota archaeon]